jgi:hypothetical protein
MQMQMQRMDAEQLVDYVGIVVTSRGVGMYVRDCERAEWTGWVAVVVVGMRGEWEAAAALLRLGVGRPPRDFVCGLCSIE